MKTWLALILAFSVSTAFAISEEDQFILETQEELNLPESAVPHMQAELAQAADPYLKSRTLFCTGSGIAAVIDGAGFRCRNFKGEKIDLSLIGLGASLSGYGGVAILHAKKKSRNFKEGTYTANVGALHIGLGIMGISIKNANESIDWRLRGVTLGFGFNTAVSVVTVKKVPKN
jgi:hypothetical protein